MALQMSELMMRKGAPWSHVLLLARELKQPETYSLIAHWSLMDVTCQSAKEAKLFKESSLNTSRICIRHVSRCHHDSPSTQLVLVFGAVQTSPIGRCGNCWPRKCYDPLVNFSYTILTESEILKPYLEAVSYLPSRLHMILGRHGEQVYCVVDPLALTDWRPEMYSLKRRRTVQIYHD